MKKAFTILEVLVVVVLVTLLIGVALFAFRHQIIAVAKSKKSAIDKVIKYEQIRTSLESIKFYVVDKYDIIGQPMNQLHYFFSADSKTINFITTNPIINDTVSVVRLKCENDSIYYYEEPLYEYIDYLKPAIRHQSNRIKLYDSLDECGFYYRLPKGEKVSVLFEEIPKTIFLNLYSNNEGNLSIVANVKSDYNISKYEIESIENDF